MSGTPEPHKHAHHGGKDATGHPMGDGSHHGHLDHRQHDQAQATGSGMPSDTSHTAHDKHAGHSVTMFRSKFWICLLLTLPTLFWGHMLPRALGYAAPALPGARWIPAIFSTLVFAYGGWVFLHGAMSELRARLPGMMTLISLAITVAFLFSVAVTVGWRGMPLWEELATLVTIMLLGHWIEMRSISQAQGALGELAKLLPDMAVRIRGEQLEEIAVATLQDGDLVLVRPGASIPADGIVRTGNSAVNEALITGESRPLDKTAGDAVIAGTVNGSGSLRVEVTGTGEQTALAGIMRLVTQAQQSRSRAQALADRAAFWLTMIALTSGFVTLVAWLSAGRDLSFAVERMVSVLVIACPHALGLAIPLVIAISTMLGARNGLLVRDRRGLEEARNLTAVVFDKTGTLTLGQHRVISVRTTEAVSEVEALRLAASVEQDSEHPVARAFVMSASERGIQIPAAAHFKSIPGYGVQATTDDRELFVGGPNLLRQLNAEIPHDIEAFVSEIAGRGEGVIYLIEQGRVIAAFALADALRPESREAIQRLHELGLEVIMLTGDAQAVADTAAHDLGIDAVFAQVLPEGKAARIEELQRAGKRVAMVGDGVNDAPALVTADVGIAIGAGTNVAVEAGDIVLVRNDPRDVARIIQLSRSSYRKMVQNLWWATGYNVIAIPLAAGVLAGSGVLLSPAVGAVLMSLSTVVVAVNAQLLRQTKL